MRFILQKATLQRPTWLEPQGFWGGLVTNLSVLLIPGQAARFVLALRNRLGRPANGHPAGAESPRP